MSGDNLKRAARRFDPAAHVPLWCDGARVGWLSSGGYGHTLATHIGYGYVREASGVSRAYLLEGRYELEVATERVPCRIHLESLYDPRMARVKA